MGVIARLFGRRGAGVSLPWRDDSIYRLIADSIDPGTGSLRDRHLDLPDEPALTDTNKIRWAAGAMDGVFGHHGGTGEQAAAANRIARLVDTVSRKGDSRSIGELYELLCDETTPQLIDEVIAELVKLECPVEPHLARLALDLAMRSGHRGPVKFGLALLGVMRLEQHRDVVEIIGRHEEFTLFAAVAFRNMLDEPTAALWELARHVHGWGRIQLVERLVPTDDPALRHWLRTEGFRNSVMYEYLALIAADHGRLREALEAPSIAPEELQAAGEIIRALVAGGPAPGMDAYREAAATCTLYLRHAGFASPTLTIFNTAHSIRSYLEREHVSDAERLSNGWSDAVIKSVRDSALELVARTEWVELTLAELRVPDRGRFWDAKLAAGQLKLDVYPVFRQRVEAEPHDQGRWFDVMSAVSGSQIDDLLAYAERALPLDRIATGPSDSPGLGKGFELHGCLDFILQDLRKFPGKGASFIVAGLRSPVVRNRNMAVAALQAWPRPLLTPGVTNAIRQAVLDEPRDELRASMQALAQEHAS